MSHYHVYVMAFDMSRTLGNATLLQPTAYNFSTASASQYRLLGLLPNFASHFKSEPFCEQQALLGSAFAPAHPNFATLSIVGRASIIIRVIAFGFLCAGTFDEFVEKVKEARTLAAEEEELGSSEDPDDDGQGTTITTATSKTRVKHQIHASSSADDKQAAAEFRMEQVDHGAKLADENTGVPERWATDLKEKLHAINPACTWGNAIGIKLDLNVICGKFTVKRIYLYSDKQARITDLRKLKDGDVVFPDPNAAALVFRTFLDYIEDICVVTLGMKL